MVARTKLLSEEEKIDRINFEELPQIVAVQNYVFKTKLNEEVLDRICTLLEEGLPPATACGYSGISVTTHYEWLKKGRQYLQALEDEAPPKTEWKIHAVYLVEIKRSIATYLKDKISNINGNFTPSWVRDITILERRDHENWGRNVTVLEIDDVRIPDESFL